MSEQASGNGPAGNVQPSRKDEDADCPFERSRFGGTSKRPTHPFEGDAPVSRDDLVKGREEVLADPRAHVNWRVMLTASAVIVIFSLWAIFRPDDVRMSMKTAAGWIALNLGWYYVLTITIVIGFVLWVAFSKQGGVRLGPDHSRTEPVECCDDMLYILFAGQAAVLLSALMENIGRFFVTLFERTLQIFAYEAGGAEWMGAERCSSGPLLAGLGSSRLASLVRRAQSRSQ